MNGACNGTFLSPPPWGTGEGQKVKYNKISLNFNYKVNFKIFFNQTSRTLCVFSQTKVVKHIRLDFHSVAWVMHKG